MPVLSHVTPEPNDEIQRRKHAVMQQTELFPIQCNFSCELQVRSRICVTTLTSKCSRSSGTVQVTIIVGAEGGDLAGRSVRPFATTAAGGNECGGLGDDQDITLSHDARSLEKGLIHLCDR